jgi:hypothetical protein
VLNIVVFPLFSSDTLASLAPRKILGMRKHPVSSFKLGYPTAQAMRAELIRNTYRKKTLMEFSCLMGLRVWPSVKLPEAFQDAGLCKSGDLVPTYRLHPSDKPSCAARRTFVWFSVTVHSFATPRCLSPLCSSHNTSSLDTTQQRPRTANTAAAG